MQRYLANNFTAICALIEARPDRMFDQRVLDEAQQLRVSRWALLAIAGTEVATRWRGGSWYPGDAVSEGALGGWGCRDAPVCLLGQLKPQDRADPGVCLEIVEHLLDPQRFAASVLCGADFADLHGLVGCEAMQ